MISIVQGTCDQDLSPLPQGLSRKRLWLGGDRLDCFYFMCSFFLILVMEIVQAEVPDEEANEVLQQVQSAVQNIQRPMVVTNDQVRSQLDTTVVAVLPVAVAPANSAAGEFK